MTDNANEAQRAPLLTITTLVATMTDAVRRQWTTLDGAAREGSKTDRDASRNDAIPNATDGARDA